MGAGTTTWSGSAGAETAGVAAPRGRVVVGVHGSARSLAALDWAARLAAARAWELDVVTAWPEPEEVFVHDVPGHHCVPRQRATRQLDAALARVEELSDEIPVVVSWLVNAPVTAALLDLCSPDSVLVVGASHIDEIEHPGARGVDADCTIHAPGALVVVDIDTSV